MANDEDFEPRPGRIRGGGKGKGGRKFLHRVIAAANLARGGAALPSRRSGFTGSRIGRGAGVGRALSVRNRYADFRQRTVIVTARPGTLSGTGFAADQRQEERRGGTERGR